MGNDIEIRVRVANQTAGGLTGVNSSLQTLKTRANEAGNKLDGLAAKAGVATTALLALKAAADDAGDSLRELRRRAEAAGDSMRDLRDGTVGTGNSLRTLNTRAQTANTRLGDLSSSARTLRSDTDDLDGSMRNLVTTMGGLGGSLGTIRNSSGGASGGMQGLRKAALLLSPALVPIAAAAVPIAGSLLAAGAAIGVFGLAIGGQIADLAKAAEAEKKYKEAVKEHGAASEEAGKAEKAYLTQVKQMDPATRRAASAFSVFKDTYKQWTKDVAGDTMPVVTKSFAVFGGLLPRLAPLVRSTSGELDRLMTVLAGGVNSAGFDRLMGTFSEFASGALSKATDGLVRFMRTMSGGAGSGPMSEFLAYVRDVGPQVAETLGNLGRALAHMVAAASDVGVSILGVVNGFAKLVNAIPTEALSALLQFVVVFKAVKMAAAGLGGAGGAMAAFGTSLAAMSAASAAAGGGLAGVAAAFGALSRAAKVALIGSGIGILVVALSQLSDMGKKTPPDIDKLTTSMRSFAAGGVVGGEAARVFGKDLSGLADSLQKIKDPKGLDQVQQSIVGFFGTDSTPVKDAKENIDALDKSLANLVKNGQADLAAAALDNITTQMKKQGFSTKDIKSKLDDYKAALADQAFEQKLAAQAMGLFGEQALAVGEKLAAQKQSADGLRQSIEALNDANRSALGGMIGFEASIDAAAAAAKENAGSLDMVNGKLDVNSPKAQAAATALSDLASKTKDAALAARESGESWESVNGIYERGRKAFMDSAMAMGLSRAEAKQLAGEIMNIPDEKKTLLKMEKEDAEAGLNAFNAVVKRTPGAKSVTLKTLSQGAEEILESFGLKVKRLPDGTVKITTQNGQALKGVRDVQGALGRLPRSKTINVTIKHFTQKTTRVITEYQTKYLSGRSQHDITGATGGLFTGSAFKHGYAAGGPVRGPGSGTSDDVFAPWLSNGEFVMKKAAVDRYGEKFMQLLNDGRLDMPRFAKGGKVSQSEKEARKELGGFTSLSYFGRNAGFKNNEFIKGATQADSVSALVGTMNQMASLIKRASHGSAEAKALRAIGADGSGNPLWKYQRNLESVNKSLEKAKDKLDKLKDSAASLSSSVKSGILSGANITKAAGAEDSQVTINTLLSQMTGSAANSKQFSGMLASLKKKGLSGSLISQIGEAGIEGGGMETAAAILGGGKNEIKKLNALQKQITASATSAGKITADAMYGAGIKAAEGLVKGLQKKQDSIEKQMMKIAKSMEKAIKKALGIKSPSKVMEEVGSFTAEGFAVGMRKNRSVTPAWESMLNVPRGGSMAAKRADVAAGGMQPVIVHQTITLDGRVVAQQIFDPLRKEIAGRGGNVQDTLGRGRG